MVDGHAGPYEFMTYQEVAKHVKDLASGIRKLGVQPGSKCGVYGSNCPEWMIAMQACNRSSAVCVPVYDSLGEDAVQYIVQHSDALLVFVSGPKLADMAATLKTLTSQLKAVITWGQVDSDALQMAKASGVPLYDWAAVLQMGQDSPQEAVPPAGSDLCTIMYTSGSTGDPKGVMLTHDAVVSEVRGLSLFLSKSCIDLGADDTFLSYLPLAHIFDRVAEEMMLYLGASIGYWQGDVKLLMSDIEELKPQLFIGVPRVFERIYAGAMAKVKAGGGVSAFLFNTFFNMKLSALRRGYKQSEANWLGDKLVFSKIKAKLGGRCKGIITGGAPLAGHVECFLRVTMCCPVIQGYGLTETCAGSFLSVPDVYAHASTVGPALPCTEFYLEAIPDMEYYPSSDPPRGEICMKGPSLFSGYFKAEEVTKEVIDADGWFHTGDVGELCPDGALKVIDRKKNFFKLSQGEYVAAEKVENTLKKNPCLDQAWVYGSSFQSYLVAVVVPAEAPLLAWAASAGVTGSFQEVCALEQAAQHILEQLTATGTEAKLKGFEMVRAVHLEPTPFSIEADLLTPTFKLRRPQLLKRYQATVDALYKARNG